MKASVLVLGLIIVCISSIRMVRAEARHLVEIYNKYHQNTQVTPILTSASSSARMAIKPGVNYLDGPHEQILKKFMPRNAKLKSALLFTPKTTKLDVKSQPLHQDYGTQVYKTPFHNVQAQSLPVYKEGTALNYPRPNHIYKPESILSIAPVIYPSAITHQLVHPHHQYEGKDHLQPTPMVFYNQHFLNHPVDIPDGLFRNFFESTKNQISKANAFSFEHHDPNQYLVQHLQQYPLASGSSPNPVVQPKVELSSAYNDHTNQPYAIQKYPIPVRKELVGKHNFEGKSLGTKTTYTYIDPKNPRNFVQVSEVKMNLNLPLNAEVAKTQLNHLLQSQETTLMESVKPSTPIAKRFIPDVYPKSKM